MTRVLAFASALLAAACAATPEPPKPERNLHGTAPTPSGQRELALVMGFFPGTYESIAQAKGPGVGTRMRVASIFPERAKRGEHWFYVEHTKIADDAHPFRQRIYRFTEAGRKFSGDVFALPGDPRQFVGEWKKAKPFEGYSPEQLREYPGCRLDLGQMTMMFWARTSGKACRAEHPEAAHEFTEMFASNVGMKNGEQAYDPAGRLIAGEPGVWDFRRIAPVPR